MSKATDFRSAEWLDEGNGKLNGDVYTAVYDRMFPSLSKWKARFALSVGNTYEVSQYYNLPDVKFGDYDIGVQVKDRKEAELAEVIADELNFEFEMFEVPGLKEGRKYVAVVRIPDSIGCQSARDYLRKMKRNREREMMYRGL